MFVKGLDDAKSRNDRMTIGPVAAVTILLPPADQIQSSDPYLKSFGLPRE